MRALLISVLFCMALSLIEPTDEASVAGPVAELAVNDVNPPAGETEESAPEVSLQNVSFPGSPVGGDETALTRYLGECPFGWHGHQARCYHFVSQADTWINAQQYCIGIDANLASARNPREYKFLQDLVFQLSGSSSAWLGGFYLQNTWLWMDGEGFYYNNWHSQSTASSYPCLYMQTTAGWRNSNCYSTRLPFICVKRGC